MKVCFDNSAVSAYMRNSIDYTYNGLGQRVSQEIGSVVTEYLLDTQPGLYKVLAATTGGNTTRYIHGATGIHSQQNPDDEWLTFTQDGLGSVRGVYDEALAEVEYRDYDPYGNLLAGATDESVFGYTGEPFDDNGLLHLRARYYDPAFGSFFNLDPLEFDNRYTYAGSNPINFVDASGLIHDYPPVTCSQSMQNSGCSNVKLAALHVINGDIDYKPCGQFSWKDIPYDVYQLIFEGDDIKVNTDSTIGVVSLHPSAGIYTESAPSTLSAGTFTWQSNQSALGIGNALNDGERLITAGSTAIVIGTANLLAPPWGTAAEEGVDGTVIVAGGIVIIIGLLVTAVAATSSSNDEPRTAVYRAVQFDELVDVISHNNYGFNDRFGQDVGKYFAFTLEGADTHARKTTALTMWREDPYNNGEYFTVTSTTIPDTLINNPGAEKFNDFGSAGASIYFPYWLLGAVYQKLGQISLLYEIHPDGSVSPPQSYP